MSHACHARGCTVAVQPRLLMCRQHWFMVPKAIRERVWAHYQQGQEKGDATPTEQWHKAADDAIAYVADREAHLASLKGDNGGTPSGGAT